MRIDWLPFSASALVGGATALAFGSLLMPAGGDSGESLRVAAMDGFRWLGVAGLLFVASVLLTIGLPAILTLLDARTERLGLAAVGVFAVGCIGLAGYAMLLVFFRALVVTDLLRNKSLEQLTGEAGLGAFLFGWIAAFYLGELLIALALFRTRRGRVPTWVPLLLVAHVATLPLGSVLPDQVGAVSVLLVTVAFTGIGITANNRHLSAYARA